MNKLNFKIKRILKKIIFLFCIFLLLLSNILGIFAQVLKPEKSIFISKEIVEPEDDGEIRRGKYDSEYNKNFVKRRKEDEKNNKEIYKNKDGNTYKNILDTKKFFYRGSFEGTVKIGSNTFLGVIFKFLKEVANAIITMLLKILILPFLGYASLFEYILTQAMEGLIGTQDYLKNRVQTTIVLDSRRSVTVENILLNRIEFFDINFFKSASQLFSESKKNTSTGSVIKGIKEKSKKGGNSIAAQDYTQKDKMTFEEYKNRPIVKIKAVYSKVFVIFFIVSIFLNFALLLVELIKAIFSSSIMQKAVSNENTIKILNSIIGVLFYLMFLYLLMTLNDFVLKQLVRIAESGKGGTFSLYETVRDRAYDGKWNVSFAATVVYVFLVYYSYKFVFLYAKRLFNVYVISMLGVLTIVVSGFNEKIKDIYKNIVSELILMIFTQAIQAAVFVIGMKLIYSTLGDSIVAIVISIAIIKEVYKAPEFFENLISISSSNASSFSKMIQDDAASKAKSLFQKGVAVLGVNQLYKNKGKKSDKSATKEESKQKLKQSWAYLKQGFGKIKDKVNQSKMYKEYEKFKQNEANKKDNDNLNPEENQDPKNNNLNPEENQDPKNNNLNPEENQDQKDNNLNPEGNQENTKDNANKPLKDDPEKLSNAVLITEKELQEAYKKLDKSALINVFKNHPVLFRGIGFIKDSVVSTISAVATGAAVTSMLQMDGKGAAKIRFIGKVGPQRVFKAIVKKNQMLAKYLPRMNTKNSLIQEGFNKDLSRRERKVLKKQTDKVEKSMYRVTSIYGKDITSMVASIDTKLLEVKKPKDLTQEQLDYGIKLNEMYRLNVEYEKLKPKSQRRKGKQLLSEMKKSMGLSKEDIKIMNEANKYLRKKAAADYEIKKLSLIKQKEATQIMAKDIMQNAHISEEKKITKQEVYKSISKQAQERSINHEAELVDILKANVNNNSDENSTGDANSINDVLLKSNNELKVKKLLKKQLVYGVMNAKFDKDFIKDIDSNLLSVVDSLSQKNNVDIDSMIVFDVINEVKQELLHKYNDELANRKSKTNEFWIPEASNDNDNRRQKKLNNTKINDLTVDDVLFLSDQRTIAKSEKYNDIKNNLSVESDRLKFQEQSLLQDLYDLNY